MFDVVGVGANSIDHVYRLPEWPRTEGPSAKLQILGRLMSPGGQTATALATCAAMGLGTKYIGTFGSDDGGQLVRAELTRRGVDLSDAIECDAPNPSAMVLLDVRTGERIVLWDRDERLALHPDDVRADSLTQTRLLHVDDVDAEAAIAAAALARLAGIPVTSDIERVTTLTAALVAAVDVPIFAEAVPSELTGEADMERALRALRNAHSGLLCVTLGSRGAMLLEGDVLHREPGLEVAVVDTTGAGDIFRGAFVYALLRGDTPAEILRFANTAGAISCTKVGAMSGIPSLAEVETAMRR